jgi:hypothetical protein
VGRLVGKESFEDVFADSVEAGLYGVLGESATRATLKHLDLGPRPTDPRKVDVRLEAIFLKSGAQVIERQILKALLEKMNERLFEAEGADFEQRVEEVRRRFWEEEGRYR